MDSVNEAVNICEIIAKEFFTHGSDDKNGFGDIPVELVANELDRMHAAWRGEVYTISKDGDEWVATAPGFVDLASCSYDQAAFGKSPIEAINALFARRKDDRSRLTWEETERIYDLVDRIREDDDKPYGLAQPLLSGVEAQELLSTAVAGFLAAYKAQPAEANEALETLAHAAVSSYSLTQGRAAELVELVRDSYTLSEPKKGE